MKKLFPILVSICLSASLSAQLKVTKTGEVGIKTSGEFESDLPVYVLDTIGANYEVTNFSYIVNESINIENDVILTSWVIPTSGMENSDMHNSLHYDGKFPVTEFIKYGYHSIRKKYVFYISPFMYDPFKRTLDLATSVTVDVETKRIENAVPEVSKQDYDVYVDGSNIIIESDSNSPQNVKIYDISGRMVHSSDFVRNTTIDKSGFDSGVYIVRLSDTNGKNMKIVI